MANDARQALLSLRTMFPTCDINTIKSILAANHGHVENTVEDLLKIAPSTGPVETYDDGDDDNLFYVPKKPTQQVRVYNEEITEEHLEGVQVYTEGDFAKSSEIRAKELQADTDAELASKLYQEELKKDKELYERSQSWFGLKKKSNDDGTQKPGLIKKVTTGLKGMLKKKNGGTSSQSSPATPSVKVPIVEAGEDVKSDKYDQTPPMKLNQIDQSFEIFPSVGPSRQIIHDEQTPRTPLQILEKAEKSFEIFPSAGPSRQIIHDEQTPLQLLEKAEKSFEIFPSVGPSKQIIHDEQTPRTPLQTLDKAEKSFEIFRDPTPKQFVEIKTPVNAVQGSEKSFELFNSEAPIHVVETKKVRNEASGSEELHMPLIDKEEEHEDSKHFDNVNYSMMSEGPRMKENTPKEGQTILRLEDIAPISSKTNLYAYEEDDNKGSVSSQRMAFQVRI